MDRKPHVMVVPFPAQGHVAPLLKFAYKLSDHGFKVTFVNADYIHARIMAGMPEKGEEQSRVRLVSIADGMESDDLRYIPHKASESMLRVMPDHLQNLIEKINQSSEDEKITCVIADVMLCWLLEVPKKMGIMRAAVSPAGIGFLAIVLHIPNLIKAGIIDVDGMPLKDELIYLSKEIPAWSPSELGWSCPDQPDLQRFTFSFSSKIVEHLALPNWLLVNSFYELEPSACHLVPNILPVGPLLTSTTSGHFPGNFWPEDPTSLIWLHKHPPNSVIYVAFGSFATFSQQQLDELALGLELTGRPFLWVVRSDSVNGKPAEFPDGFIERVSDRAKIVEWTSQEKVLSHPATACFLSHCGWNSTTEGLSMGIPFLCWPYFADQFHNRNYICEAWKIGLGLDLDEDGIITRHEIDRKVTALLSDNVIKENALRMKEMATKSVSEGGSSYKNFERFVEEVRSLPN